MAAEVAIDGDSIDSKLAFGFIAVLVDARVDVVHKIGKADMGRVTKSSGLPTRLHQQVRKLRERFGRDKVDVSVDALGRTTTSTAKRAERARLQAHFDRTGEIPYGNLLSFVPDIM